MNHEQFRDLDFTKFVIQDLLASCILQVSSGDNRDVRFFLKNKRGNGYEYFHYQILTMENIHYIRFLPTSPEEHTFWPNDLIAISKEVYELLQSTHHNKRNFN